MALNIVNAVLGYCQRWSDTPNVKVMSIEQLQDRLKSEEDWLKEHDPNGLAQGQLRKGVATEIRAELMLRGVFARVKASRPN